MLKREITIVPNILVGTAVAKFKPPHVYVSA